jgi:LPS export ABC transporter protein LptC
MTPSALRRLQLGLLVCLVLLVGAVGLSLRRQAPSPTPSVALPAAGPANTTRTGELVYTLFDKGHESLELKARAMRGSQADELTFDDVEVRFPYVAQGEPGRGTIVAKQCRYSPAQQKASFRGDVQVRTADGLELSSPTLVYRGDKGLARTDDPVTFKRKDFSGSSTGFVYFAAAGGLELSADVVVRLTDPDKPPVEIRSGRAQMTKADGSLEFLDGVDGTQGSDRLKAATYALEFVPATRAVKRAVAVGDVELTMQAGGTAGLPGMRPTALAQSGPRVLTAPKLDLWFRPDRSVEELNAGPNATLRIFPGAREKEGLRTLSARILVFRMDSQGRLSEVQGQKDTSFRAAPAAGSKDAPLDVRSRGFVAQLDPQSGAVQGIDFFRDVEFERGTQRASTVRARYEATQGRLRLLRRPELDDSATRSRLTAEQIELETTTGNVSARGNVRHTIEAQAGANATGGLLAGRQGSTVIAADTFQYVQATRTSRYEGQALLRAGADEVRAPTLTLAEGQDGKRQFTAEGGVLSRLHPQTPKGGAPAGATIEARAKLMVYSEAANKIAYRQEVVLRRERLLVRSPRADLWLSADGRGLERLVADEPVELDEGERKAKGARATYTPADERIVIDGPKVVLSAPGQQVEGRTLTLHLGDDRIVVDGREEARTETVFRKEPRTP